MPGVVFMPRMAGHGSVTTLTFSFLASASGTDNSVEISAAASIAANDLALIMSYARGPTGDTTPSGFTKLRTANTANIRGSIFAKKLDGTETTVTSLSGGGDVGWVLLLFRPTISWTSWTDNDTGNVQGTTGNPTSQTINAGSAGTNPVLAYGSMNSQLGAIDPRTTSPAMDEVTNGSTFLYAHYKNYASSPANHSYDMDDEGAGNVLLSGYLTFIV